MKRSLILALSFLSTTVTFAYPIISDSSGLTNLSTLKDKIIQYKNSGCYEKQLEAVSNEAISYLTKRIKENEQLKHPKKLAVAFDIDETTLSNYPYMKSEGFGGTIKQFYRNACKAKDPAIKPVLKLYQFARAHNVSTFVITGRKEKYREVSMLNLKRVGYTHWTGVYFEPKNYHTPSAIPFKTQARKEIEAKGYDIVISIGDQYSDSRGGYADRGYKLPDPFYYIP